MRSKFIDVTGVLAAVGMVLVAAAPAHALGAKASLAGGVVTVSGSQAAKSAPVSWEGVVVTTANKGGSFAFTTPVLPLDCIGTLTDGTSSIDVRITGCSDVTTGLPGTGQTTIYAAGDDADVRAGGLLNYTDNGNGTLTDNRTGLTWEKKTEDNVNITDGWGQAFAYIAELNALNGGAGFAGHNDWRLPNVKELLSIVDYGRFKPAIDPMFGPTAGPRYSRYWTSTSWAAFYPEVNAWAVDFADEYGNETGVSPTSKGSSLRVRAVRGGL